MENTGTRNDHSRISPTAKITAYWRSLSDIPYSKEIAEAVAAEETAREMVGDKIVMMGKLSPSMFELRYKSINYGLRKSGIDNVMELACGLSPRGLEIATRGGVYVGTDLPDMYAESSPVIMAIAKRTGVPLDNLHLQPANVLNRDEMESAAGHFNGKKFAVCNEGLLMYLNTEEKSRMARHIRELLLPTGGCWITTDITLRETREKISPMLGPIGKGMAKLAMRNITRLTGRDITGNDFANKSEALKFYRDLGFAVEEFPMYAGNYELSTASLMTDSLKEKFTDILSSARAWILKPKK